MSGQKLTSLKHLEVWFVTGSQHLYGEETLKQVAAHSAEIAGYLNDEKTIPVEVTVRTNSEVIR